MTDAYYDGSPHRMRTVECDYCGLRYARWMLGAESACSECLTSRAARIRACHLRMRMRMRREQV